MIVLVLATPRLPARQGEKAPLHGLTGPTSGIAAGVASSLPCSTTGALKVTLILHDQEFAQEERRAR